MMNREEWLSQAVDLLRPYFKEREYPLPELITVSCGFADSKTALGVCYNGATVVDGVTQIYITPRVSDSIKVLDILSHELVHAALPDDVKAHGKEFRAACKKLGLVGKAKFAQAGDELLKVLDTLLLEETGLDAWGSLPAYPHSKLVAVEHEKKQTTRMKKILCPKNIEHPETDIVLRASKKILELGTPKCFCGSEFLVQPDEDKEHQTE